MSPEELADVERVVARQLSVQLTALSLPPPSGGGVDGARSRAIWHARKSLQYAFSWAVGLATPFVIDWLWRVFT